MEFKHSSNVEETWDTIADSFDATRRRPWSQCLDFVNALAQDAIVADLGCGNGRHLIPCAQRCQSVIGLDISRKLLQITYQKVQKNMLSNVFLIHGNLITIPLKNDSIDAALYIAALHNIQGKEHRHRSLQELQRILKSNGRALVSVWSRWQDRYRKYFIKQWLSTRKRKNFGDIEIFWKQHRLDIPRFYHLYSKREFIADVESADLMIEKISCVHLHAKRFPDNYFALVRKK